MFDFSKFTDLMNINTKDAFLYRDSCFKKNLFEQKITREELIEILTNSWISFRKNLKTETLIKKALENNLIQKWDI